MKISSKSSSSVLIFAAFLLLQGCGGESSQTTSDASAAAPGAAENPAAEAVVSSEGDAVVDEGASEANAVPVEAGDGPAEAEDDVETIDPEELEPAGKIELKQYTVAWVGSGTMGGGTLIVDGKEYPFRLAGLGVGGYGASSIDASGVVYNLPSLDAFPGTYGNARLGMTGGDSGGGRLWLRNPDGVVIELESEMRGLALAGGVDGILIQWEDQQDSQVDEVMDDTRDAAGKAIDVGADAVQGGVDSVKGWFKKDD